MARFERKDNNLFLVVVAFVSWLVPGAGYFLVKEKKRAVIVFSTIVVTFCIGIYIGSIGVIDPVGAKPWYAAQILNSPLVAVLGHLTSSGVYVVYGKPCEIGQIYTSISGLLNLLCIINSVHLAYSKTIRENGA